MAEINENHTELVQPHEHEYEPENEHEYAPENEHEYAPENEHAHMPEHEEDKHELDHGLPDDFHPDEEQGHVDQTADGGGDKWPGWPGESVFRILVAAQKVGSIIGRKGEYIKKTCEETRARIKILDGPPGTRERAVMVSAREEPNAPLPPAVDGLLRVHGRVVDGLESDSSHPPPGLGVKVSTRLLVPAAQAGSVIGKQGTTVKSIQEESNCIVRVLGAEELPVFALQDDRIIEVVGEPASVHKAVELIASHLRKFLVDRSIIPIIETQMQTPNSHVEHMPPTQPWGPPPQYFPPNASVGGYGASPRFMPPPRQYDNHYPPADMPPPRQFDNHYPPAEMPPQRQFDNHYPPADMPPHSGIHSHQGISAYGREGPMPVHSSSSQSAPSIITQVTKQMQIPLSYADAVIGTQGTNISYVRRVSGAAVTIKETRGIPEEMTVEISGTSSQVQTAQQLIQNFMAEAAGPPQAQHASSADHGYNSYGAHDSLYASQPSNPSISGQAGGNASGYSSNYGY